MRHSLLAAFVLFLSFSLAGAAGLGAQQQSPLDALRALRSADSTYEAGDRATAIPDYRQVVAGDTLHAHAWYRLGRAYEAAERWRNATAALERAHGLGYQDPWWIAERLARLHLRLSEPDRAVGWLETSLTERNEDRPALREDAAFEPLKADARFQRLAGTLPDSLDRVAGWRHDLRYLVEEARRLHVGPDRPAFSTRFESLADSIEARISELDDADVILELDRLVNLLGDGHSTLYPFVPNRRGVEFPGLPVVFHRFDDGVHIVAGTGPAADLVGSRVVRIGALAPDEVLHRLLPYVNRDNAITPLWLGVRFYLPSARYLVATGAAESPDRVTLTLEDPSGGTVRRTLPTGSHDFPRKLRHPAEAEAPPPLWMRDVDVPYRIVRLPGSDALYVPFNQVRDAEEGLSIAAFADSLRAELERSEATDLIVDVRHNNGGNAGLLPPLIRTLVWWEEESPDHRIWIAAGRNTFSAAQVFLTEVERWTDATFAGERSSSRPNFTGEETSIELPWSGVRGSVSSRHHQVSVPGDERSWIDVDLPVPYSSADWLAGRDPVLEAILDAIDAGVH